MAGKPKTTRRPAGTVVADRIDASPEDRATVEKLQTDLAKAKAVTTEAGKR
jgi:hypothetical protein